MKRINCVPLTRRENDRRVFVQTRERRGFAPDPTRGMIPLDPAAAERGREGITNCVPLKCWGDAKRVPG